MLMKRVLLQNGTVYDGLGHAARQADVLLADGKILKIGAIDASEAENGLIIDAAGKIVCPGFVDMHRHCDAKPLNDDNFGERELLQGITTTVVGNCGISLTPCSKDDVLAREMYDFNEPIFGHVELNLPRTYEDYVNALDHTRLPLNMASMVGTGSVKIMVKRFSDTPYTQKELDEARALIEDALKRGAVGISLGIMYLPECYSSTEEFAYILKPVGEYGRVITTHIRGEGDSMVESVREVIEIAKKAGCALQISHFKSAGVNNWRKDIYRAVELIEKARAEGQDVTCDFYPYEGGGTPLTTMLPPVFVKGDMTQALKRLGTPEGVEEFRRTSRVLYNDWDNFCITLGWDRIIISSVSHPKFLPMRGMIMTEAAEKFGYEDVEALAADIMHTEDGRTSVINMSMCQDDIDYVAKLPYSCVISDSIYADTDAPHPRMYGAFPKIIREYVLERGIYTMEEAIHKMTGLPAARMKLDGRGTLTEGSFADILVFKAENFRDHATFTDSAHLATGLDYVFVNGELVVENGVWNREVRSGRQILA